MSRGKVVLRTGPVVAMVIKVVSRGLVFAFGVVGFVLVLKISVVSIFGVVGKCFCVENDMPVLVLRYVPKEEVKVVSCEVDMPTGLVVKRFNSEVKGLRVVATLGNLVED